VNLARRIVKLEKSAVLTRENRLILRFIGTGSEGIPQASKEDLDNGAEVFTVCFIAAKDGRPA
jgi:hypothetical protein